jgi:hypothetical protein
MTDPLHILRRRGWWTGAAGSVLVIGCAVWALRPLPAQTRVMPVIDWSATAEGSSPDADARADAFDAGAFGARIWSVPAVAAADLPPPPPPPAPNPLPPPPPLKLQLVGIIREPDGGPIPGDKRGGTPGLRAALYDPDTDRLFIVASGERIGDRTVRSITPTAVELSGTRGTGSARLALVRGEGAHP